MCEDRSNHVGVFPNHPKCRKLMLTQTHCVESRLDLLSAIRAFAGCGRPGGPRFLRVVFLGPGSLICSRKCRRQRTRQAKLHAATNQSINRPQSGCDKPAAPQPAIKTENGEGGTHDAIQKQMRMLADLPRLDQNYDCRPPPS